MGVKYISPNHMTEVDELIAGWRCIGDVAPQLAELAKRLECERRELIEALHVIVDLDDGDKPGFWDFAEEFDMARALLQRLGGK